MLCTAEYFADELNRHRPLTDAELDKLQAVLCRRSTGRRMWTAAEDRELLRLSATSPRRYAGEYAAKSGRTEWSVRSRLRKIRRK
jgi:hypothetical protein